MKISAISTNLYNLEIFKILAKFDSFFKIGDFLIWKSAIFRIFKIFVASILCSSLAFPSLCLLYHVQEMSKTSRLACER